MTLPLWSLLGFALWTLLLLSSTVGWYRWSRILTGREAIASFRVDPVAGSPMYQRAMRAHAIGIENLPVFGAIVLIGHEAGICGDAFGTLSLVVLTARVVHGLVHVGFEQTNTVSGLRFMFFFVRIAAMIAMGVMPIRQGLA